jgi:hypothetical protein
VIKNLVRAGALLAVWLLALAPARFVLAQAPSGSQPDRISVNDQYVLRSGATHAGNLTVVAREVTLEEGSTVNGDLSVVSAGPVTLNGQINGDVSILAPSAQLGKTLRINGSLSICAREVKQASEAIISGSQSTGCNRLGDLFSGVSRGAGNFPPLGNTPFGDTASNPLFRFFQVIFTSLGMAALAALAAAIFPRQVNRMSGTAISQALTTTLVGFLSIAVAVALSAIYVVSIPLTLGLTCLGLPIVGLLWLVIGIALVVGWIAVSIPFGTTLLHRMKVYPTPMVAAALGTLVLTLVQGLVQMIPCIGWIGWLMLIVIGSAGFGAVLLTRFGTRPYPEMVMARARPEIL